MPSDNINYAERQGAKSLPAAIVFAVIYGLLLPVFVYQRVKIRSAVPVMLAISCATRIAAFAVRAALIKATDRSGLASAQYVLFSGGLVGLLFCAYTAIRDREGERITPLQSHWILTAAREKRNVDTFLLLTLGLSIPAAILSGSSNPDKRDTARSLNIANTVFVMLAIVVVAGMAGVLLVEERLNAPMGSFGKRNGGQVLLVISVLLFLRGVFVASTIDNLSTQRKEVLWYPLVALPDVLVTMLFTIPDLVVPEHKKIEDAEADRHAAETRSGHEDTNLRSDTRLT